MAAELLGKVGDEPARDKGAAALLARAPKGKPAEKLALLRALGTIGGPTAVKYLETQATGADKEEAANAVRALQVRRDPAVLPFALKVAGDAKADKVVRDEMFGVLETIGGKAAREVLEEAVKGPADLRLTREAKLALITFRDGP